MLLFMQKLRMPLILAACLVLPKLSLWADEKTEPPVPVRMVAPVPPEGFSHNGSAGLVTVHFLVDDKGNVQEPTILKSSHPDLEEPAIKAIKKWRFKPARRDGLPVAVQVSIPIKFQVE
jgi:protein TonB